nr:glycosyltransferase family 4 protein [Propionibacterium sp.]
MRGHAGVLWFSNETPDRFGQGGQRRQYFQIAALVADGHPVHVLSWTGPQDDSSIRRLCPVTRIDRFARNPVRRAAAVIGALLLAAARPWDCVVIAHAESWPFGRLLGRCARRPVLVDLHNVNSHWLSTAGDSVGASAARRTERSILRGADAVTVCADRERGFLEQSGDASRVIVLPHGVAPDEWTTPPVRPTATIKMFGNWGWPPNQAGLEWFLSVVWPLVRAEAPEAIVEVAGTVPPGLCWPEGSRAMGRVPRLDEFCSDAAAIAVPVKAGVGAPLKFAEALASGIPVVATSEAAHGSASFGATVTDEPGEWVRALVNCLNHDPELRAQALRARSQVLTKCSWAEASRPLRDWVAACAGPAGRAVVRHDDPVA